MTQNYSNYGTLLYQMSSSGSSGSATLLGALTKLEPPAIKAPTINTRNHGSGIYPQAIFGGVLEIDPFSATFSFDKTDMATMQANCISGSPMNLKVLFPNTQAWYFSGLISEWSPQGADSNSPELLSVKVGITPTGTMIIV